MWQTDSRHHYSKDQPWSADGAVLALQNKLGDPPRIYLNGLTYAVLNYTDHTNPAIHYTDWRWHPGLPYVQIVLDAVDDKVYWIDARYPAAAPIVAHSFAGTLDISSSAPADGIGQFEGNVSANGNLIAITKAQTRQVFILNMATGAVGNLVQLPSADLFNHTGTLGWTSISPDGKFLVAKYAAANPGTDYNDEQIRVFDVDPVTLAINSNSGVATPRVYPVGSGASVPCGRDNAAPSGDPLSPADGWVHPLKHADMMMDGSTAILVGVNGCTDIAGYADRVGRILRVDLTTGKVTTLSRKKTSGCDPSVTFNCYNHEAPASHVSCRNLSRPGWAYVTYGYSSQVSNTKQFSGEIVAVPVDSSVSSYAIQRFVLTHSSTDSVTSIGPPIATVKCGTECEPQGVPDLYGRRIVWASNWNRDCAPNCGLWSQSQSYLLDATCVEGGCPFLETWTNSGWRVENSILSRSLTGNLSWDAYRLKATPQVVNGVYRLMIRENERELTTIDQTRLAYVDHPADVRAYALGDRLLLARRTPPYRVTTSSGKDVTDLLDGSSGDYFVGDPGEALTVELVGPRSSVPPASVGGGGEDLDPFEIDPGEKDGGGGAVGPENFGAAHSDAAILTSTGILVQGRNASGTWTTFRTIYPRKEFAEVLVDTLDQGPVRLVFVGRHKLRFVGRVLPASSPQVPQVMELVSAQHSRFGSVLSALVSAEDATTTLAPSDSIVLEYSTPHLAAGQVRDFFMLSRGTYQSTGFRASQETSTPRYFALHQNHPNPFHARTSIRFQLPIGSMVRIDILDAQGRRVQTLVDRFFTAGHQSIEWDPRESQSGVGPGVYFYQIRAGLFREQKQMVLLP